MFVLVYSTCSELFCQHCECWVVRVSMVGWGWGFPVFFLRGRGVSSRAGLFLRQDSMRGWELFVYGGCDGVADSSYVIGGTVGLTHSLAAADSFCHCG